MATEYSDAQFQDALLSLRGGRKPMDVAYLRPGKRLWRSPKEAPPPREERQRKISLHDIVTLLKEGTKSGLSFAPMADDVSAFESAEVPWNRESAEALMQSIMEADLEPVRTVTWLCNQVAAALEGALQLCKSELPKVHAGLDLEDRRIAQISGGKGTESSLWVRMDARGVAFLRDMLDRFDRAERKLSTTALTLGKRGAEITEYLLIDSAMDAALQISPAERMLPLRGESSAKSELDRFRQAFGRLESALAEADTLVRTDNATRLPQK